MELESLAFRVALVSPSSSKALIPTPSHERQEILDEYEEIYAVASLGTFPVNGRVLDFVRNPVDPWCFFLMEVRVLALCDGAHKTKLL